MPDVTTTFSRECPCGETVQIEAGVEQPHRCRPISAQQVRTAWAEGYQWARAEPRGFHPGYDVERYGDGRWVIYRTTRDRSPEVARGRTTVGLLWAYWRRRLFQPVVDDVPQ